MKKVSISGDLVVLKFLRKFLVMPFQLGDAVEQKPFEIVYLLIPKTSHSFQGIQLQ